MAEILFQLKLETAQFSKALQDSTTKIKPASLPITFNSSTLDNDLKKIRAKLNSTIQLEAKQLIPGIKTTVALKVDKQSGNDLAKTIASKLESLLQNFTRINYNGIDESIKSGFKDVKIKPEGNLFSGLFDTLTAPLQSVIRGSFEGIGQGITVPLGKSVSQGLETGLSDVIGSFELIGTTIGERVSETIQDYLVASGKATDVVQQAEQFLGAKNIARVSGSDRTKREQTENIQVKQAQIAFIKDQQQVVRQLPESQATLKAIKQARTQYIEALEFAGKQLLVIQTSDIAKKVIELQQKLRQGIPDVKDTRRIEELTSLSAIQPLTPDQTKEKTNLLVKVKDVKNQILSPENEANIISELNPLLTKLNKESNQIIKKINTLQSNLESLNIQEKTINDAALKPQKALAQLGNTTALKLENIQKQILAAKVRRDKILELLLENSIKIDKATDESEKNKYQQIFNKAKQLLIKNKQDQTILLNTEKFLQQALSVPGNIKTASGKAEFVKNQQIEITQAELNKKVQQSQAVENNIKTGIITRNRGQNLEAESPLTKAKTLSNNVIELEQTFANTDIEIAKVDDQVQELTNKLVQIQNVLQSIKVKEQSIIKDVQSGAITSDQGVSKLQETAQLKTDFISKGASVSKDRVSLRETRSELLAKSRSTSDALKQAVTDRNDAVEYLDTPEAVNALQAVKTYREWISKSNQLIENETKKLKQITQDKLQLEQNLAKLKQPKTVFDPIQDTAKQIYENIAKQVNAISGITQNVNLPTLKQDPEVREGAAGYFQGSTNTLGVSESTIKNLQSGNISDQTKTIILHEIRHSIQPKLRDLNVKLLKATEDELKKFGVSIERSVASGIKQNPNLSEQAITRLRELEEDAYVFAERFLNKVNVASVPDSGDLIKAQNAVLNSVKVPNNFSVPVVSNEVKKVFKSSDELKKELETYTVKQLRELATKLNIKNVGKGSSSTKSGLTQQINALYGVTGQGRDLVSDIVSRQSNVLTGTQNNITEKLKLNQKAIKTVLDKVTQNQSVDNDKLIQNIIKKTEEQLTFVNTLKETTKLTTTSRRSLGGIKTQLQFTLVQAKSRQSDFENQISKVVDTNVQAAKKQVEAVQQSISEIPDRLAAFYDDPSGIDKKIQEIEDNIRLDADARRIGANVTPNRLRESNSRKKLQEIERKLIEDLQANAIGIIPNASAPPLPPRSVTADLNRLKDNTSLNFEGKFRQTLAKQITTVKNTISKLQNNIIARLPVQLSEPITKAQTEASIAINNAFAASKNLPTQVIAPVRRAIAKFNSTLGTQLQVNALSAIETVSSSLAAVETGVRGVPRAARQADRIRNIPNTLEQRSRNAVVTKSRFVFDNSDAINTLVSDQVSRAPNAAKATNLVQTLTTQRNKLADLFEVYNRAPTTAGFNQIKTTLNDLEKTLKDLGVPLPKINKLLDEYTKRTRELQGRGIIPLDFEIPTAEKFNPIIDAFGKFGGAGSKVINTLFALGKGFLAFQGVNFLQNQLSSLAKESFQVATRFEALQKQVEFTSGSVSTGAKNFKFASDEAIRLKQPLEASVQSFSKLTATTRNTVLEGAPTEKIFTALSQAALVEGLSPDRLKDAQLAITQIAAKGVVSLEELRGQLAEALPDAIQVASRAFGITERDLFKLVETGKLTSNEFLIKFSNQLAAETSAGVTGASNTAQASINALSNSLTQLQLELGKSVQPAVVVGINALSGSFKFLADNIETLQAGFAVLTLGLLGLSLPLLKIVAQFIALRSVALIPIGSTIASVSLGLGKFILQTAVLQVALQTTFDTFRQFTNAGASDITQFADKTQQALDRIAKSAEDTKNKLAGVGKPQPFVPESQGAFDRVGRGAAGEVPFSDTLKGRTVKFLVDTSPLVQANVLINKTINKVKTGKFEYYSEAERIADERRIQSSQALLNIGTITGQTQKFVENRGQGKVGASARVREISNIDKQISDLSLQKEAIAIRPGKGKDQIAASTELEKQINILIKKRNEAATEYEAFVTEITTGLSSTQQALNAELAKGAQANPGVIADLQASLSLLQITEKQLAQVRQEVGNVDATQKLADSLFNLSDAYDNAANASSKFLTQQKLVINDILNRTTGTDRLASQKAGLADVDAQLKATRDQIVAQEKISQETKALVGSSLNESVFKAAGITDDTSIGDLKLTSKRTTDPKIKQAIDALIQIKIEEDKVNELRLQESQTLSQRQNIIEQNTVENLEFSNQQVINNATRTTDKRISEIRRYQRQSILGETSASIEISKIQIKTAEDSIKTITKRQQELNKNRSKFTAKSFEQQSTTIQNELSIANRSLEEARLQSGNEVRASELVLVQAHAEALQAIEESRYSQGLVSQEQYNQQSYRNTQHALDEEQKLLNKRRGEIQPGNTEDLDKLNKQQAELDKKRAESRDKYYKDEYKQLDDSLTLAEGAIKESETKREAESLRLLANGSTIDKQLEADKQRIASKKITNRDEINIEIARNKALKSLQFNNPEDRKQNEKNIQASAARIAELTNAGIQLEIDANQKAIDITGRKYDLSVSASRDVTNQIVNNLEREKQANDVLTKSLETQVKLLQARKGLSEARLNLQVTQSENATGVFDRALELRRKTQPEQTPQQQKQREQAEKAAAQTELNKLGLGGASELDIIDRKIDAENKLAALRLSSKQLELQLDQRILDLEIERDRLTNERLLKEAVIAQRKAEQAVTDAATEVKRVTPLGDPVATAAAQNTLETSQLELEVSSTKVSEAYQQLTVEKELAQIRRDSLDVSQQATRQQAEFTEAARQSANALTRAGAAGQSLRGGKDSLKVLTIGQLYKGGAASPGTPYLVGENPDGSVNRTTELFVPKVAGQILNAETTQNMIAQVLRPRVTVSQTLATTQRMSAKKDVPVQTDKAVVDAIANLHKTVRNGAFRPQVEQENSFTIVEQGNADDVAMRLHRQLLLQR